MGKTENGMRIVTTALIIPFYFNPLCGMTEYGIFDTAFNVKLETIQTYIKSLI